MTRILTREKNLPPNVCERLFISHRKNFLELLAIPPYKNSSHHQAIFSTEIKILHVNRKLPQGACFSRVQNMVTVTRGIIFPTRVNTQKFNPWQFWSTRGKFQKRYPWHRLCPVTIFKTKMSNVMEKITLIENATGVSVTLVALESRLRLKFSEWSCPIFTSEQILDS